MVLLFGDNDYTVVECCDDGSWVRFDNFDREYLYGGDGYPVAKSQMLLNRRGEPDVLNVEVASSFACAAGKANFYHAPADYGRDNYGSAMSMMLSICAGDTGNGKRVKVVVDLLRVMDKYGVSILHAYEEGVSVDDLFLLDKTRNMNQLFTMLDLLRVDWMYVSRERTDDGYSAEQHGNMRSFNRLPWIEECVAPGVDSDYYVSIRDYPVFTDESITIMKSIGMRRVLDFVLSIGRMNCDANGCTREQVRDTFNAVLDSGNPLIADCMLNVIKHTHGASPVITGDVMTLDWLREHCTIPGDIMSDNLEAGVYSKIGSNANDLYMGVLQRILNTLDDADIDSLGIDADGNRLIPDVEGMTVDGYADWLSEHYDELLTDNDAIAERHGIPSQSDMTRYYRFLIEHGDGERAASTFLAHGLMRNWYHDEYSLADGRSVTIPTGKLLHRFMGYLHTLYMDKCTESSTSMAERTMNVLNMMLELDEESFARLSDIRCTAYGASVMRPTIMGYVPAPVWFPRTITCNYDSSQYDIIELFRDDADSTMFPMGMNRMLTLLELALDNGTDGIDRLDTLCRNIVINDSQYTEQDNNATPPTWYSIAIQGDHPVRSLKGTNPYQAEREWLANGTPITRIRVNNAKYMRSDTASRTIDLTGTPYWLPM